VPSLGSALGQSVPSLGHEITAIS